MDYGKGGDMIVLIKKGNISVMLPFLSMLYIF